MAESTNNTKQAAWLMLGNLFSFGFGIVSAMILSRYFDKEEYGTYRQILYVYNTLLGFFTLGLPHAFAYFLPRSPIDQAKSVISKITNLFFILGGILSLVLFFGADYIADVMNNPAMAYPLKIFSPTPFLMMPTMGLESILATYRQTKFMTVYVVLTRTVSLMCIALPVLIWGGDCNQAVMGFVISSCVSFVAALYLKYYPVRNAGKTPTDDRYSDIFKFCIPLFVASIWGVLINSTPQFFISRYYGSEMFAVFSNGSMELPFVGMVIGAVGGVLTPLFSREVYKKENFEATILPTWISVFVKSAIIIYPITIFCMFNAEKIMVIMYGDQYAASGSFFEARLICYFVKIIAFFPVIIALGATKFYQKVFFFELIALIALDWVAVFVFDNPVLITLFQSFCSIGACSVLLYFIASQFKVRMIELIPVNSILIISTVAIMSCIVAKLSQSYLYTDFNAFLQFCLNFTIFVILYIPITSIFNIDYLSIIKPLFTKK